MWYLLFFHSMQILRVFKKLDCPYYVWMMKGEKKFQNIELLSKFILEQYVDFWIMNYVASIFSDSLNLFQIIVTKNKETLIGLWLQYTTGIT